MADPAVQAVGSFFGGGSGSAVEQRPHVRLVEAERITAKASAAMTPAP